MAYQFLIFIYFSQYVNFTVYFFRQKGTLVTHNTAIFERVEGLELIDWY
jgi:hypothetical protein